MHLNASKTTKKIRTTSAEDVPEHPIIAGKSAADLTETSLHNHLGHKFAGNLARRRRVVFTHRVQLAWAKFQSFHVCRCKRTWFKQTTFHVMRESVGYALRACPVQDSTKQLEREQRRFAATFGIQSSGMAPLSHLATKICPTAPLPS